MARSFRRLVCKIIIMTLVYPIFATILAAFIDYLRIRFSYGQTQNIGKFLTVNIAALLFALCLGLSVGYYDLLSPLDVVVYLVYYVLIRLCIYSPLLNVMRGLYIFRVSRTTNSKVDQFFIRHNIPPVVVMLVALIGALIFGLVWLHVKQ